MARAYFRRPARFAGEKSPTMGGCGLTDTSDPMKKAMRQIAGAFAELEKARLVAKLKGSRERKRAKGERVTLDGRGKCEGRKSVAELRPEVIEAAGKLNDGRSLRAIAAGLAEQGFVTRERITPQPASSACSPALGGIAAYHGAASARPSS